jgi:tetratricopeptide (TPR) repeat protein
MDTMPGWVFAAACFLLVAACSSPHPAPEDFARALPPQRELSPAQRERSVQESAMALEDLMAGRFTEAVDRAREALAVDPRSVRARAVLGRGLGALAWKREPPDHAMATEAEGHLLLALRLSPEDAEARLFYAQLLVTEGHLSRAGRELDVLLAKHPENEAGLRAAANVRYELGEERAAAPLLSRLLAAAPQDAWALYRLANCRVQLADAHLRGDSELDAGQDRVEVAVATFQLAAKTFGEYQAVVPNDPTGYLGEAHARYRALVARKKPRDRQPAGRAIVALYQKARTLDPQNPATFHGEGAVWELLGDREMARTAYEAALRLDPKHVPSVLNLAALLYEEGEKEKARDLWRQALVLDVTAGEKREIRKLLEEKGNGG